ncbi:hypothetical protein Patl1_28591 [Pistacia atlantica]|uniref:Uncharacterized protein n=1 Tax=Pistacia atlantica TaxID=434234 RepID=A0ACC1BEJ5_9ROSI|nr:hypothetical protein Patl1_28591 [Pistacia atlantica]
MTFQREEEAEKISCNNQTESETKDNEESRIGHQNIGELLSLGLNKDEPEPLTTAGGDNDPQSKAGSSRGKIFSCNFCLRKFYSSQALGGHQNAHKRERGAFKRFHSHRMMMTSTGFPFNSLPVKSLGVQPHSLVHKPNTEAPTMVARFPHANTGFGFGTTWPPLVLEEPIIWPGSFRVHNSPNPSSDLCKLDLNLRL